MKSISFSSCILLSELMGAEKQAIQDYRNAYKNIPIDRKHGIIKESNILRNKLEEIGEEEQVHFDELLDLWERGDCKVTTSINV